MNQALATRNEDPRDALAEWKAMTDQAKTLVASGFLPRSVNTPEKAIAIIMTGREMGIPPMRALRQIHIIEGKPTLSAELMHGLVLANLPGSTLQVVESTDARCTVDAGRPGQRPTRFVWDMAKARTAGLTGKSVWKNYPAAMLRSRCVSEACRAVFPDVSNGCYTPEELGGEGDNVTAADLGGKAQSVTVTETKPEAPTELSGWVTDLIANYEAVETEEALAATATETKAQLGDCGATDAEKQALNKAYTTAKKRIRAAPKPAAQPEPADDDAGDPEAREAEADSYRGDFE